MINTNLTHLSSCLFVRVSVLRKTLLKYLQFPSIELHVYVYDTLINVCTPLNGTRLKLISGSCLCPGCSSFNDIYNEMKYGEIVLLYIYSNLVISIRYCCHS